MITREINTTRSENNTITELTITWRVMGVKVSTKVIEGPGKCYAFLMRESLNS